MPSSRSMRLLPWISTPILLIVFFVGWDVFVRVLHINELVLPRPIAVFEALEKIAQDSATWEHARTTVLETTFGFLIALVFGTLMGVVLGKSRWIETSLRPMIVASQVVPYTTLFRSKVVVAALLAFFPIMLNVQLGVRSVESGQREVMRSLNASRWQTFKHLELNSTMPYVFAGMEVGIVFAIIGTIVGEYLGGSEGLGYLVVVTLNDLDAPRLFAVIILLAAIGLALYALVNTLKRFFIPWHESVYNQSGV